MIMFNELAKDCSKQPTLKKSSLQLASESFAIIFSIDVSLFFFINRARNYLDDLGIFKTIDVHIDITRENNQTPHSYDVVFTGKENSRLIGGIGTEIGQNEGSLTIQVASPNLFGRGEKMTVQASHSNIKTNDIAIRLSKPFFHTSLKENRPEISFSLFKHSDKMEISGLRNSNLGVLFDFSLLSKFPMELRHSFQYESAIKEIAALERTTPFVIRQQCGPRMSSLFRYKVGYDSRDNYVFPNYGFLVETTNELCGFGGNIGYMLNNTRMELNIPLFSGFVAQVCSKFGLIQRDKTQLSVPISNLFIFGGNQTLRGFHFGGAGPQNGEYSLGAHVSVIYNLIFFLYCNFCFVHSRTGQLGCICGDHYLSVLS